MVQKLGRDPTMWESEVLSDGYLMCEGQNEEYISVDNCCDHMIILI